MYHTNTLYGLDKQAIGWNINIVIIIFEYIYDKVHNGSYFLNIKT